MRYYIRKVRTKREQDDFVRLPALLYKDCPYYVPDLECDVRTVFSRQGATGRGEAAVQPFNAYDAHGQIVGRVVAIAHHRANAVWQTRCVRFGMIEFVDDIEVSRLLLEAVEQWGMGFGLRRIQGPMGLTDFDKEGMLVEDFDQMGSMITIYNPPYYPRHLEQLGYVKEVDWVQVRFDIPTQLPERYYRVARLVRQMYGLRVRKLSMPDVRRGYGDRVFALLNKAYKPLFGFTELNPVQCRKFLNQYLPLIDLRMVPVVEDEQGNMVAVAITIGSLSHALRRCGGKLWPWGWLHLLKVLKLKHEDKVEMMLIAVDPEYQGLGVNALLFEDLIQVYRDLGYKWAETGPMLETNLKVLTQWRPLHPITYKRRRCYSKAIHNS